jgi:hypothetical protein
MLHPLFDKVYHRPNTISLAIGRKNKKTMPLAKSQFLCYTIINESPREVKDEDQGIRRKLS